jgi:hypothetical protein
MTSVDGASPCNKHSAARQSAAWPPVSRKASGRPRPSLRAWILVVRPPRLTPRACALKPLFHRPHSDMPSRGCCRAGPRQGTACSSQCLEQFLPDALGRPTDEPIIERLSRAIPGGNANPTAARLQRHDDAADDPAIVDPRHATQLVRQQRSKSLPRRIGQTEPLRHGLAPFNGNGESQQAASLKQIYGSRP